MSQSRAQRIAAIESLLPLLEAHQHVSITAKAQWVSPPDEASPPRDPEPSCECHCPPCPYLLTKACTLRNEQWAAAWESLRRRYPQLHALEILLNMLGSHHGRWAAAIYRVYVPLWSWDVWDEEQERALARLGVAWMADRFEGFVPLHVDEVAERIPDKREQIVRLRTEGKSYHAIAHELGCSKSTVRAALTHGDVRHGRVKYAEGA